MLDFARRPRLRRPRSIPTEEMIAALRALAPTRSQTEIAVDLDLVPGTVSKWCHDYGISPTPNRLRQITGRIKRDMAEAICCAKKAGRTYEAERFAQALAVISEEP